MAGTDTTRNQLACAVALFAQHPDQFEMLAADQSLVPGAVEEVMRYLGAIRGTARYASKPITYRDIEFPANTFIFPSLVGANHDGEKFAAPADFDITRRSGTPHLTFGSGIHYCLGAFLARAELAGSLQGRCEADAGPAARRGRRVEAAVERHLGPGGAADQVYAGALNPATRRWGACPTSSGSLGSAMPTATCASASAGDGWCWWRSRGWCRMSSGGPPSACSCPAMADDLGLSDTLIGALSSANMGAYFAGVIIVTFTAGRIEPFTLLRAGIVTSTVGLAVIGTASSPAAVVVGTALAGLGGGGIWLTAPVIASDGVPASRRGAALGTLTATMGAALIGVPIATAALRSIAADDALWRPVWIAQAMLSVVLLAALTAFVRARRTERVASVGGFGALFRIHGWKRGCRGVHGIRLHDVLVRDLPGASAGGGSQFQPHRRDTRVLVDGCRLDRGGRWPSDASAIGSDGPQPWPR